MKVAKIRKPLAAAIGVTIGGVCALLVTQAGVVTLDPSSIVFVTVLLVDITSAEAFYITAAFRILGTLIGLAGGAIVSFASNAIVAQAGGKGWEVYSFQLACVAIFVFSAFYVDFNYPKYGYFSIIFVFTSTALVFSGTSNAVTIATVAAVIGGCIIATTVMWIFSYESAEATLLRRHQTLLCQIIDMVKWSVRANPRYREDYLQILDETKTAFDTNADYIANYNRWMKWTCRKPLFDFIALTSALRPLYNQTAAFFWAVCRERVVGSVANQHLDARYLFCLTTEHYFEFFHHFVTEMVEALDSMQGKVAKIFSQHPHELLGKLARVKSMVLGADHDQDEKQKATVDAVDIFKSIMKDDMVKALKSIVRMKYRYGASKASIHPTFPQQWLFSDYIYQITLVLVDLLEYLKVALDTAVPDMEARAMLHRKLRVLMIRTEALGDGGFLQARSFDEAAENLDEAALQFIAQTTDDYYDSEKPLHASINQV